MSITSYLGRRTPSLRMPASPDGIDHRNDRSNDRNNARAKGEPTGIVWHGAVVQGRLSTTEAFSQNDHAARNRPQPIVHKRPTGGLSNTFNPHA